jgi:hypothetical protein
MRLSPPQSVAVWDEIRPLLEQIENGWEIPWLTKEHAYTVNAYTQRRIAGKASVKSRGLRHLKHRTVVKRTDKPPLNEASGSSYGSGSSPEGSEEGNHNGNGKHNRKEADSLARYTYLAYTELSCPVCPPENLIYNCGELIRMGYTREDLKAVVEWCQITRSKFRPQSPASLTDPEKFDQRLVAAKSELKGKEPVI